MSSRRSRRRTASPKRTPIPILNYQVLPAGTTLWRTVRPDWDIGKCTPCWFAFDQEAIQGYAYLVGGRTASQPNAIGRFVTTKPLSLLDVADPSNVKLLQINQQFQDAVLHLPLQDTDFAHPIEQYRLAVGSLGRKTLWQEAFVVEDNSVHRVSQFASDLLLAKALCASVGSEGWIFRPSLQGRFHDEVMICVPEDSVQLLETQPVPVEAYA